MSEDLPPPPKMARTEGRMASDGSSLRLPLQHPTNERSQSASTFLSNAESCYNSYVYSDNEDEDYSYEDSQQGNSFVNALPSQISTAGRQISTGSAVSLISDGGYRFWSMEKVQHYMQDTIREASELLCIPDQAAVILLRKYKWDGKKLMDDFFGDRQEDLLRECGVLQRCACASTNSKSTGMCAICFDDELEPDDLFGMNCGHEFCKDCWGDFIKEAISQGPRCVYTTCPDAKCTEVVTKDEVAKVASTELLAKFEKYQLRSYVETNWLMRYCPGPACERVAVGSSAGLIGEGVCGCGTRFCLKCGEMQHVPATCQMLIKWKEKCEGESETANWMLAKTKKCPKCMTRINKNGGCSHMTCSQCNYQFCWLCMQDWNIHGYNRPCNKFELESAKKRDSEAQLRDAAERELERYLHCFHRFQNHSQSQEFAQSELEKFQQLQDEKEKTDFSFDWNALKEGLCQLVECRRVLKYTYVATYGMVDQPQPRELLEDNQALLESFTERLSEMTERDYQEIDRAELVNLTRVVKGYAASVVELELYG